MPNINKVVYGGNTLIDLTDSTLNAANQIANGVTAYDRSGTKITGTLVVDSTYSVTKNLTDVSSSSDDTKVIQGNSFFTEMTPASGYVISSITVTMGGVDITDQVFKPGMGAKAITANGTYSAADDGLSGYTAVSVNVSGGVTPTGTKNISISSNGTTTEDVTNYATASISVNVPNSYTASDEGKVVSNGALVAQGSDTVTTNGTVDTTLISSLLVNVPTGGGNVFVVDKVGTGTNTIELNIPFTFTTLVYFSVTPLTGSNFPTTTNGRIMGVYVPSLNNSYYTPVSNTTRAGYTQRTTNHSYDYQTGIFTVGSSTVVLMTSQTYRFIAV